MGFFSRLSAAGLTARWVRRPDEEEGVEEEGEGPDGGRDDAPPTVVAGVEHAKQDEKQSISVCGVRTFLTVAQQTKPGR